MKNLPFKALLVDHYDSFTYNLSRYFIELGVDVEVFLYDDPVLQSQAISDFDMIVLSPGPRHPSEIKPTICFIRKHYQSKPILGICLGHQALAHCFGGHVVVADSVLHGKLSTVKHDGDALFQQIPPTFNVTRYHSLVIDPPSMPNDFKAIAFADDEIMAIRHETLPLYGLQYHPEAYLTQYGHQALQNFIHISSAYMSRP